MPQLLLMRHGKAAQNEKFADRDRPLTPRGRRDSEVVGRALAHDFPPDRILCSPASRTRETLAALTTALTAPFEVSFVDQLYDHSGDYTDIIAANAAGARRLLVIGHNPAIQETAVNLIGTGDRQLRGEMHEKFPTSAVAAIGLESDWTRLEPLSGRLLALLLP
jgi:phosphohistidine phosphatase